MDMQAKPKRPIGTRIKQMLQHPTKLRIIMAFAMMLFWYFALAAPLTTEIGETVVKLDVEDKRLKLGLEIEKLRVDLNRFQNRLPKGTDSNEWMTFMLESFHGSRLKLNVLDSELQKDIGPYRVAVVRFTLEGTFREIDEFIRWVDTNDRLLRIDDLRMQPTANGLGMTAQIVLLGVMG